MDYPAFRTGLMGHQRHSQDLLGDLSSFGGILGDLNPAAFAASAGVNLSLDYDAAADAGSGQELVFGCHIPCR